MKIFSVLVILLLCGCIGLSQVSAAPEIPDLVGNWSGVASGYYATENYFFNETNGMNYTLSVHEQHGPVLNGTVSIATTYFQASYVFSGIIDHDMKTLYIAETGTGMDIAHIISPTEIEFIGMDLQNGTSMVVNFTKEP